MTSGAELELKLGEALHGVARFVKTKRGLRFSLQLEGVVTEVEPFLLFGNLLEGDLERISVLSVDILQ